MIDLSILSARLLNILFLGTALISGLTIHECAHAWAAYRRGDPTAKYLGRISLNPLRHLDPIGGLMLLVLIVAGVGFGWAKPVPVNPNNLRRPVADDILVTLAGPGMNLLLAVVLIGLARAGLAFDAVSLVPLCLNFAQLSLLLCFFNLIPIPPLDGSQIVRCLGGFSYEAYYQFARYGIIILIIVLQIPLVTTTLSAITNGSFHLIASVFGFPR